MTRINKALTPGSHAVIHKMAYIVKQRCFITKAVRKRHGDAYMRDAGIDMRFHPIAVCAQLIRQMMRIARQDGGIRVAASQEISAACPDATKWMGWVVGPSAVLNNAMILGSVKGRKSYGPEIPMTPLIHEGFAPVSSK